MATDHLFGNCLLPVLILMAQAQLLQGEVGLPQECKLTRKGREYVGHRSTTVSGRSCQRWDQHVPHRHYVVGHAMPEMSLTAAENYCRNPGYGRADPWCYTVDPQVVWEYCRIPYCQQQILNESLPDAQCVATKGRCGRGRCCVHGNNVTGFCDGDGSRVCCLGEYECEWTQEKYPPASTDCLSDPAGKLYRGRTFRTVDYHQCQRWDAQYPNRHDTNGVGSSDYNYCRNKYLFGEEDDKTSPWCYTMENKTEWQLCNIPKCSGVTTESYYMPTPQPDDNLCSLASGSCGSSLCCADGHFSNHLCSGADNRKCCFSWFDCSWKERKKAEVRLVWPTGSYAIPMSVYACPDWARKHWDTGSATLSADNHTISWPAQSQLKGPYTHNMLDFHICASVTSSSTSKMAANDGVKVMAAEWPKGGYCILMMNGTCPKDFVARSVEMPLTTTKVVGVASYMFENGTNSTVLGLCCRDDGEVTLDVILPSYVTFYLISLSGSCQGVVNMTVQSQVLAIRRVNDTKEAFNLHLCFYQPIPIDTCYKAVDSGWDYRGAINVTHKGPCQPWSTFRSFEWSLFIDYAGIAADTNNCRWAYFSLEPIPWCFSNNYRIQCGVPKCTSTPYEKYPDVALNKPARQMDGNTEGAQQAIDGQIGTCTNRVVAHKPWWQVNLRDIHSVHAVQITRQDTACPLRLFDIYVSKYPDDFRIEGSTYICRRNFSAGTAYTIVAECAQPIKGQYVTIVNLAHVESDIRADFKVEACFQICDVKVFAKATHCGLSLTTTSGAALPVKSYQSSSSVLGFGVDSARLFSKNSWCAKTDDRHKFIQVDLGAAREVTGLLTQGNNGESESMVKTFVVQYSAESSTSLVYHEESPGVTQVFRRSKPRNEPARHMFHNPFKARYVRISIRDYVISPCIRLDLLGCIPVVETKISTNVTSETYISTKNFPKYYGQAHQFQWTVKAKPGAFAQVHFLQVSTARREEEWKEGGHVIKTGSCQDQLNLTYGTISSAILPVKDGERIFLSNGPDIHINLTTCHRYRIPLNDGPLSHFGFNASTHFSDCPGCSVQANCQGTTYCATECGHIMSINFPSPYPKNAKCTWEISVAVGRYVALEFLVFDIFEETSIECQVDYVELFDFDYTGKNRVSIGRFCNSHSPPKVTLSSWNKLGLELMTNFRDERPGFHAQYKSLSYAFSVEGNNTNQGCPQNWLNHGSSCYYVSQTDDEYVTWLKARDICIASGGHLVSINDQREMEFIHYTLTTLTKRRDNRFYIGLSDREKEGSWTWEDGSPVTFSAWSVSGDFAQPDGSETEDCTMILLDNIYSFNQWHDIPCSYNKVNQYICETRVKMAQTNTSTIVAARQAYFKSVCPATWFKCPRGECIRGDFVCDGKTDCFGGGDEVGCASPCEETSYQCANGNCISLTLYCDFVDNCGDGSDEHNCVFRKCDADEYKCSNGECIPSRKRCDLIRDCVDGTDENNCLSCQADVAYQCYDGTCIPKTTRCDNRIDCPGSFHEDESLGCATETHQTCADWLRDGYVTNGSRFINPGSLGAFKVECEVHRDEVVTVVHHNTAVRTSVHGYEEYLSYVRNVTYYDVTMSQISALKSLSLRCEQYMKLECFASSAVKNLNGWYDIKGELNLYNSRNERFPKCKCWLDKACEEDREVCWCMNELDGFEWFVDEGYLRNKSRLPITAFTLQDTGDQREYVYHTVGPLRCYQAVQSSVQKFKCKNGQPINRDELCKEHNDQHGHQGCRDRSHLENCGDAECENGYLKCPSSYCIPVGSICDGTWDCPRGEDEVDCKHDKQASCPGMYKCKSQWNCIQWELVCNGERDCSEGDDEGHCSLSCPDVCTCTLLSYVCKSAGLTSLPGKISINARKMDLSSNALQINSGMFSKFYWLGELILSRNNFSKLETNMFINLKNLYLLDLSFNKLAELESGTFVGLINLKRLLLTGNKQLRAIHPGAFQGLDKLPELDLSGLDLEALEKNQFQGLKQLQNLSLADNKISQIVAKSFTGLDNLVQLNLSVNKIETFSTTIFDNLNLEYLQTDDFRFCCLVQDDMYEENCLPARDEISSCEDLMRDDLLRATLWVLGLCAFFGNGFVFIWRFFNKEGNAIHGLFVQHLALSDFLMGLYLLSLGAADAYFRGEYIEHSNSWRNSWMCNALGAIATISSETSVFMLCSITADRFINIVFPFGGYRLNQKRAYIVLSLVWTTAILIACLPLLPIEYFKHQFYSRAGVCVSLHITRETPPGWEYSVAIFHGLNLAAFLCIAFAYGWMFKVIKETGSAAGAKEKQTEIAAAKKMVLIVLTDFLCWVPINVMGFIAMAGGSIPGDVYAWTVVLLLPINSAINPILYTISSMNLRKRQKTLQRVKTALAREVKLHSTAEYCHKLNNVSAVMVECSKSRGQVPLAKLINTSVLSLRDVLHALREVTRTMADLHEMSLCFGSLDLDDIFICLSGNGLPPNVWVAAKPRPAQNEFQLGNDVDELKNIIVKIIRVRTK